MNQDDKLHAEHGSKQKVVGRPDKATTLPPGRACINQIQNARQCPLYGEELHHFDNMFLLVFIWLLLCFLGHALLRQCVEQKCVNQHNYAVNRRMHLPWQFFAALFS